MNRVRILLADDHLEMLKEVRDLLSDEYEIVGEVDNGRKLVEAAALLHPDLIVTDISMPIMTGFEAVSRIRSLGLSPRVVFLSVQSSAAYIKKARALGADAYVLKVYTNEQLPVAITSVLNGTPYFPPELGAGLEN